MKSSLSVKLLLLPVMAVLLLAGCATAPKPLTGLIPGKELETIQSAVSLSVKISHKNLSARGFLIFKRPDRFHLVLLSPFGATFLEIYTDGEKVLCLLPAKERAYSGDVANLPHKEGLRIWGLMRWVLARPELSAPARGEQKLIREDGSTEQVLFAANGLVQRKRAENGDEVIFADYGSVDGVAFPHVIEIRTQNEDTVKITFEEPEINKPVDESTLVPRLDGLTLLPFAEFPGF